MIIRGFLKTGEGGWTHTPTPLGTLTGGGSNFEVHFFSGFAPKVQEMPLGDTTRLPPRRGGASWYPSPHTPLPQITKISLTAMEMEELLKFPPESKTSKNKAKKEKKSKNVQIYDIAHKT